MKLSKAQANLHNQAMDLVNSDKKLSRDERFFVLENFHEGATNMNGLAGAFFTPESIARCLTVEIMNGSHIIDLCAGIGALSLQAFLNNSPRSITCLELNPEYYEVGKRVLPEAEWILADALTHQFDREFDFAISNPPFGNIKTSEHKSNYTGSKFEYKIIERASQLAKHGAFIIPQASAGFEYSGVQHYKEVETTALKSFIRQTGIQLEMNCGIDLGEYREDWKGVTPKCEIVTCDFTELKKLRNVA